MNDDSPPKNICLLCNSDDNSDIASTYFICMKITNNYFYHFYHNYKGKYIQINYPNYRFHHNYESKHLRLSTIINKTPGVYNNELIFNNFDFDYKNFNENKLISLIETLLFYS